MKQYSVEPPVQERGVFDGNIPYGGIRYHVRANVKSHYWPDCWISLSVACKFQSSTREIACTDVDAKRSGINNFYIVYCRISAICANVNLSALSHTALV